ncbi:MAG: phospho-N-acetylmuramoyl-pentapeptide-transferase [Lachnospiraceae bacterium]|nr:phospho-N-acetylmuramoyl-pentapeptide-transferase [Lachnospiraceae bacterium]
MNWYMVIALIATFAITMALAPVVIPWLRRLKFGNTEREEGVKSHLKKAGTPSMGGMMFLAGMLPVAIFLAGKYPNIIPVLILTIGFGIVGFMDDYLKVVKKNSDGLLPWQKLGLQFVITCIFVFWMLKMTDVTMDMIIPFTGGMTINIGILSVPFLFIVVLATVNGVNFTDGVDGLASSVTVVVAFFFVFASIAKGAGLEPLAWSVIGGLLGFLWHNAHPAKIFMGDTGSLALGGFVAGSAYMLNMPLFIPIIGIIYTVELLSVVMQVSYFKMTHGKRIFKMTPIHHHFELSDWSETKVVTVFTIVTILFCTVGYMAM